MGNIYLIVWAFYHHMQFHFLFHLAVFQVPASPVQSLLKHSENWVDLEDGFGVFFLCYFSFRLYYIALDNTLNIFHCFILYWRIVFFPLLLYSHSQVWDYTFKHSCFQGRIVWSTPSCHRMQSCLMIKKGYFRKFKKCIECEAIERWLLLSCLY